MAEPLTRVSKATKAVLSLILDNRSFEFYSREIYNRSTLQLRTVYAILERLEGLGWLKGHWEDGDPASKSRPLRRYYQLTPVGRKLALRALRGSDLESRNLAKPVSLADLKNFYSVKIKSRQIRLFTMIIKLKRAQYAILKLIPPGQQILCSPFLEQYLLESLDLGQLKK